MKMILAKDVNLDAIAYHLEKPLTLSRFKATLRTRRTTRRAEISFHQIRLREAKKYCGNHPAECEFNPGQKLRKANFLEGLDWVSFNDMLNTFCDAYGTGAEISSVACNIRRGSRRRTEYGIGKRIGGNLQWEKDGPSEEISYNPNKWEMSNYPEGTPGEYRIFMNEEHQKTWKEIIEA